MKDCMWISLFLATSGLFPFVCKEMEKVLSALSDVSAFVSSFSRSLNPFPFEGKRKSNLDTSLFKGFFFYFPPWAVLSLAQGRVSSDVCLRFFSCSQRKNSQYDAKSRTLLERRLL